MIDPIFFDGQVHSLGSRPGRSARLVIETQELPDMKAGQLLNLAGKQAHVYFAIKEEPFSAADTELLAELRADYEMKGKTPATRLRAVLYRVWEMHPQDSNFNDFYAREMERIIEHFKGKLV